jgi:hypothetical protein
MSNVGFIPQESSLPQKLDQIALNLNIAAMRLNNHFRMEHTMPSPFFFVVEN